MAEYNWGETGKAVPSPNRPVQPNWAERGGVLSFLASTLSKTQYDYQQKVAAEAQRQKDIADMARVKEQTTALKDVEYMKGMQDRLQAMQTNDPEYAPLADELRRFAISKGLRPETVENPALKAAKERFTRAEAGDFSDFAGMDPKLVKKLFEGEYDSETSDAMLIAYDKWKKEKKQPPLPGRPVTAAGIGQAIGGGLRKAPELAIQKTVPALGKVILGAADIGRGIYSGVTGQQAPDTSAQWEALRSMSQTPPALWNVPSVPRYFPEAGAESAFGQTQVNSTIDPSVLEEWYRNQNQNVVLPPPRQ